MLLTQIRAQQLFSDGRKTRRGEHVMHPDDRYLYQCEFNVHSADALLFLYKTSDLRVAMRAAIKAGFSICANAPGSVSQSWDDLGVSHAMELREEGFTIYAVEEIQS